MSAALHDHTPPPLNPAASLPSGDMKSPTAFRTISEVADDLKLPQHVLRFWESKFQQIRPLKRGGGRRYYRPEDVQVIHDIKELLYNQGFTIRGVQKLMREKGGAAASVARSMVPQPQLPITVAPINQPQGQPQLPMPQIQQQPQIQRREIENVLAELKSLRKLLQQSGI